MTGKTPRLGVFEFVVLAAVARLSSEGYGVNIRDEIEGRLGRRVSLGAVYATLDRLERKGLVRSWLGDPTPSRGGKSKRYFSLEAAGKEALSRTVTDVHIMIDGLNFGGSA